jgi:hypothetical protein
LSTRQTRDTGYKTELTMYKAKHNNYEVQYLINQILKYKIRKKNNDLKNIKINSVM